MNTKRLVLLSILVILLNMSIFYLPYYNYGKIRNIELEEQLYYKSQLHFSDLEQDNSLWYINNNEIHWLGFENSNSTSFDLLKTEISPGTDEITQTIQSDILINNGGSYNGLSFHNGSYWTISTQLINDQLKIELISFNENGLITSTNITNTILNNFDLVPNGYTFVTLVQMNSTILTFNLETLTDNSQITFIGTLDFSSNHLNTKNQISIEYSSQMGPNYHDGLVWYFVSNRNIHPLESRTDGLLGYSLMDLITINNPRPKISIELSNLILNNQFENDRPGNITTLETFHLPIVSSSEMIIPILAKNQTGPANILLGFDYYSVHPIIESFSTYIPSIILVFIIMIINFVYNKFEPKEKIESNYTKN